MASKLIRWINGFIQGCILHGKKKWLRQTILLTLVCTIVILNGFSFIITSLFQNDVDGGTTFQQAVLQREDLVVKRDPGVDHDKWIVLTTIFDPTQDVKFLAKVPGWKVVVVGDTKTPTNWSHPNCIFLSVSKQLSLGLKTPHLLPYRHYSRKNIGYLYAIMHGAKVIYETDDDNRPLDNLTGFELRARMAGLMYAGNTTTFNPYCHFGQSTLWPRGYPLSKIGEPVDKSYSLYKSWKTPTIQQGVVNGDPDMDAIFRLTRKQIHKPLQVQFDSSAPPVILPPGVFSPFNSQNTLFLKEAFWALLIPTTTTFRMCDIWRGYWAQRLLWEIGGTLGFFPPNAYQTRSAHDYLADMNDENDMYYDTDGLLEFLANWTCPVNFTFFQCGYQLSLDMAREGYWRVKDAVICKHWMDDLINIGYSEPLRITIATPKHGGLSSSVEETTYTYNDQEEEQEIDKGSVIHFSASEQIPPVIHPTSPDTEDLSATLANMQFICDGIATLSISENSGEYSTNDTFYDILLIVIFNFPFYKNANVLDRLYRPYFKNIVYCGEDRDAFLASTSTLPSLSFIEVPVNEGYKGYACTASAMEMNYGVKGYLVVGDDSCLNIWNLHRFNRSQLWLEQEQNYLNTTYTIPRQWYWWELRWGYSVYHSTIKSLRELQNYQQKNGSNASVTELTTKPETFLKRLFSNLKYTDIAVYCIADTYYIPQRLKNDAIFYLRKFLENDVFLELAVPQVFYGLDDVENIESLNGLNLWEKERWEVWKRYSTELDYLHPIKLSQDDVFQGFCKFYINELLARM